MALTYSCAECGAPEMKTFNGETMKVEHEGRSAEVTGLGGWRCPACSEVIFDRDSAKTYADAGDALVLQARRTAADPTVWLHLEGLDKHPPVPAGTPCLERSSQDDRWAMEVSWTGITLWLDVAHRNDDVYPLIGSLCYWQAVKNGQPELAQAWDDWVTACRQAR